MTPLGIYIFPSAREYIRDLSPEERGAIGSDIRTMSQGDFGSPSTKQLEGPIRELIVGNHRITYFKIGSLLCFVNGFRKRSQKTPRVEIEYATRAYRRIQRNMS